MRQTVTIFFLLIYMLPAVFAGNMLMGTSNNMAASKYCSNDKIQDPPPSKKSSPADHHSNRHPVKVKSVSPSHFFVPVLPAAFDNITSFVVAADEKNIFLPTTDIAGNCVPVWQPPRLS